MTFWVAEKQLGKSGIAIGLPQDVTDYLVRAHLSY